MFLFWLNVTPSRYSKMSLYVWNRHQRAVSRRAIYALYGKYLNLYLSFSIRSWVVTTTSKQIINFCFVYKVSDRWGRRCSVWISDGTLAIITKFLVGFFIPLYANVCIVPQIRPRLSPTRSFAIDNFLSSVYSMLCGLQRKEGHNCLLLCALQLTNDN
jgi:hypothetical protein